MVGIFQSLVLGCAENGDPPPFNSLPPSRPRLRCSHPWAPSYTLPIGNPITGREWNKPRRDTGTYVGGTITDYEEG